MNTRQMQSSLLPSVPNGSRHNRAIYFNKGIFGTTTDFPPLTADSQLHPDTEQNALAEVFWTKQGIFLDIKEQWWVSMA